MSSVFRKGKEMSITEELRTMLDDRGIKWDEILDNENLMIGTRWKDSEGYFVTAFAYADCQHIKTFTDFFWQPTPKQAVEATLGIDALEVENAKLREQVDEARKQLGDAWVRCVELMELARFIMHQCNDGNPICEECINWNDGECVALLHMRELGIEV